MLVGLAYEVSSELTSAAMARQGTSPAGARSLSSDAVLAPRLLAESIVGKLDPAWVNSQSSDAELLLGLKAKSMVRKEGSDWVDS